MQSGYGNKLLHLYIRHNYRRVFTGIRHRDVLQKRNSSFGFPDNPPGGTNEYQIVNGGHQFFPFLVILLKYFIAHGNKVFYSLFIQQPLCLQLLAKRSAHSKPHYIFFIIIHVKYLSKQEKRIYSWLLNIKLTLYISIDYEILLFNTSVIPFLYKK